jgi:hypothetical protein
MLRVIHSNIEREEEPKKKRVPLWKDEAALARGLREFIEEHNAKFRKQQISK